jgi:hypothetical protein
LGWWHPYPLNDLSAKRGPKPRLSLAHRLTLTIITHLPPNPRGSETMRGYDIMKGAVTPWFSIFLKLAKIMNFIKLVAGEIFNKFVRLHFIARIFYYEP